MMSAFHLTIMVSLYHTRPVLYMHLLKISSYGTCLTSILNGIFQLIKIVFSLNDQLITHSIPDRSGWMWYFYLKNFWYSVRSGTNRYIKVTCKQFPSLHVWCLWNNMMLFEIRKRRFYLKTHWQQTSTLSISHIFDFINSRMNQFYSDTVGLSDCG